MADFSFAEAQLHTGRTHQIRVHAAHLGTAAGWRRVDISPKARQKVLEGGRDLKRMFLHAHQLKFLHPGW